MIEVLFDCVLLKEVEEEKVSSGGIVMAGNNTESTLTKGEVVKVGEGRTTDKGVIIKPVVSVGDNVLFNKNKIIDSHTIDGVKYLIIREKEIVGIVD